MRLVQYPDRNALASGCAEALAEALGVALGTADRASFAVPGGTTPAPIFEALSRADLDWARVTVILGDERWVPENSDRSNAALVRRHLLQHRAADAAFAPFYRETEGAEAAMPLLSGAVAPLLPVSVALLGMGADMHTASLFPGADRLAQALAPDAPPVMALRAPGAPEPRVSLTGPVLRRAGAVHVVITGAEKRDALDRAARQNDPLVAPICIVLPQATVHWAA